MMNVKIVYADEATRDEVADLLDDLLEEGQLDAAEASVLRDVYRLTGISASGDVSAYALTLLFEDHADGWRLVQDATRDLPAEPLALLVHVVD